MQVKAIACELPSTLGLPLSRLNTADIVREAKRCGIVATLSDKTVWRWLNEDAIRPWQHRCWIFPRDPDFAPKAGRILDLYARQWQGQPLQPDEFVISADEKTSIQGAPPPASLLCPSSRANPLAWNTNTTAVVPGPIWQHSTFTEPECLAVASPVRALPPLIVWWLKS